MSVVMLVDGDRYHRLLLSDELEHDGHDVVSAARGDEALDRLAASRPDLVVVELRLPDMDGMDLIGRLAAMDERLPVVVHTGTAGRHDEAMALLADDYVVKSSNLSDLMDSVRRLLPQRGAPLPQLLPTA